MTRRLAAVVVGALVVLAGCGSDGSSGSFEDGVGPIDRQLVPALAADADPDAVPEVQRNFLDGCVLGFADGLPDLEPVQQSGLLSVCGCSFEQLVTYSRAEAARVAADDPDGEADAEALEAAAFEIFTDLENDIRIGEADMPSEVLDLIRTCVRSEAGL